MKRAVAITALASVGFVAPFVPMTASSAATDDVTLVYGIQSVNADVYVDGKLDVANMGYKAQTSFPLEGNGNILLCVADPTPPATTEDCGGTANQVMPIYTYKFTGDSSATIVAGFEPDGGDIDPLPDPALLLFEDDLACARDDARVSLYHAAASDRGTDTVDSVDGFAGAFKYASGVKNGGQQSNTHDAPNADVTIDVRRTGNGNPIYSSNNGDGAQQTAANHNTITILTGAGNSDNPYDVIYRRLANEPCPTTSTAAPPTSVTAVSVTPKFTG